MKIFLILIFSISLLLSTNTTHHHAKIIEKIIIEMSIGSEIKIWSDNKNLLAKLKQQQKLETTSRCEESNIIILDDIENLPFQCSSKHIFVLKYNLLTKIKESFGALFWKKGRPNIVIIEPRIKAQSISISKNLEPYLEERVW